MKNFTSVYPKIENYLRNELIFLSQQSLLHSSKHQTGLMFRIEQTENLIKILQQNPSISNVDVQELGNMLYKNDPNIDGILFRFLLKENPNLGRFTKVDIPLFQKQTVL